MTKNDDFWRWIEAALNVIGGKWKLLIVLALMDGTQRYSEISHKLPAISERMLVKQSVRWSTTVLSQGQSMQ